MREVVVSKSRSPLEINVLCFGRIQSSGYIENHLLIYLPPDLFFLNTETGFLER